MLKYMKFCRMNEEKEWLFRNEGVLYQLPEIHYGFVRAEFSARAGDVVELFTGTDIAENGVMPKGFSYDVELSAKALSKRRILKSKKGEKT